MSATSPFLAIGALALVLATTALLQSRFGTPAPPRRFASLDGLRGYAASLVCLQHASAWYFFARTGVWSVPPSRLYAHFGQSSVAIFFMITGLLFWSKLIDARARPIDWRRLFVGRILRLTPLFVVLIGALWVIGLATSGFHLRVSPPRATLQTIQWLTFTIAGMPDINRGPSSIIGGVAWSLPYEWWFYLSLPMGALLITRQPPLGWLAVGVVGALCGAWWVSGHDGWPFAANFLGGIAAAYLVREPKVCLAARHPAASLVCLAALAAVSRFSTPFAPAPLLLLSLAFAIIACGNSLFGVLEWQAARGLGEIGYSVYLLHSVVLFVAFGMMLGAAHTAALSATTHWLVVYACLPVVVIVSFATFHLIEAPGMASADRVITLMSARS